MKLIDKIIRVAGVGLVVGLPAISGCGAGVYSKDPKAGFVYNETAPEIWDLILLEEKERLKRETLEIQDSYNRTYRTGDIIWEEPNPNKTGDIIWKTPQK